MRIEAASAREILDSRGQPTVEVEVRLSSGHMGRAAVPSGASTGEHEALELRDGDKARFWGSGVLSAVRNVAQAISPRLKGEDAADQRRVDRLMIDLDGTPAKSKLGANAILGASMAVSRAAAAAHGKPLYRHLRDVFGVSSKEHLLPAPMLNILNGGRHADNGLDIQEFMIVPTGAPTFREALRWGAEAYQALKKLLAARGLSVAVGDEGGFAPRLKSHEEALDLIKEALRGQGRADSVRLALDAAASEFYNKPSYKLEGKSLSASDLARRYDSWREKYGLVSIKDPFDQDDWQAWRDFTARRGADVKIIGDDIFVTNRTRLERGIREKAANAILIKLNQIGTVTETVEAVLKAKEAGFSTVISHRSGETEDPYIADLAVALDAGAIKTGAPCRSERLAKYNQLLRIEEELGPKARYAMGRAFERQWT